MSLDLLTNEIERKRKWISRELENISDGEKNRHENRGNPVHGIEDREDGDIALWM